MSEHNLSRLRADADWLCEKHPISAARLSQAIVLLECAGELTRKAERLLETVSPALTDRHDRRVDTGHRDAD